MSSRVSVALWSVPRGISHSRGIWSTCGGAGSGRAAVRASATGRVYELRRGAPSPAGVRPAHPAAGGPTHLSRQCRARHRRTRAPRTVRPASPPRAPRASPRLQLAMPRPRALRERECRAARTECEPRRSLRKRRHRVDALPPSRSPPSLHPRDRGVDDRPVFLVERRPIVGIALLVGAAVRIIRIDTHSGKKRASQPCCPRAASPCRQRRRSLDRSPRTRCDTPTLRSGCGRHRHPLLADFVTSQAARSSDAARAGVRWSHEFHGGAGRQPLRAAPALGSRRAGNSPRAAGEIRRAVRRAAGPDQPAARIDRQRLRCWRARARSKRRRSPGTAGRRIAGSVEPHRRAAVAIGAAARSGASGRALKRANEPLKYAAQTARRTKSCASRSRNGDFGDNAARGAAACGRRRRRAPRRSRADAARLVLEAPHALRFLIAARASGPAARGQLPAAAHGARAAAARARAAHVQVLHREQTGTRRRAGGRTSREIPALRRAAPPVLAGDACRRGAAGGPNRGGPRSRRRRLAKIRAQDGAARRIGGHGPARTPRRARLAGRTYSDGGPPPARTATTARPTDRRKAGASRARGAPAGGREAALPRGDGWRRRPTRVGALAITRAPHKGEGGEVRWRQCDVWRVREFVARRISCVTNEPKCLPTTTCHVPGPSGLGNFRSRSAFNTWATSLK